MKVKQVLTCLLCLNIKGLALGCPAVFKPMDVSSHDGWWVFTGGNHTLATESVTLCSGFCFKEKANFIHFSKQEALCHCHARAVFRTLDMPPNYASEDVLLVRDGYQRVLAVNQRLRSGNPNPFPAGKVCLQCIYLKLSCDF